jgi:hypothetical protein
LNQPSKKEARIARQNLKALQAQEKSARLVQSHIETKPDKDVRVGANPDSIFHMSVVIECHNPDVEDAWSWGVPRQWCCQEWAEKIEPRFAEWSNLTWAEIDEFGSDSGHKMHHNMECDDICEEAQDRMIEIDRFYDVLFRFRAGNLERVWCYRKVNTFHVLWYDPTHKIYPTG